MKRVIFIFTIFICLSGVAHADDFLLQLEEERERQAAEHKDIMRDQAIEFLEKKVLDLQETVVLQSLAIERLEKRIEALE